MNLMILLYLIPFDGFFICNVTVIGMLVHILFVLPVRCLFSFNLLHIFIRRGWRTRSCTGSRVPPRPPHRRPQCTYVVSLPPPLPVTAGAPLAAPLLYPSCTPL